MSFDLDRIDLLPPDQEPPDADTSEEPTNDVVIEPPTEDLDPEAEERL